MLNYESLEDMLPKHRDANNPQKKNILDFQIWLASSHLDIVPCLESFLFSFISTPCLRNAKLQWSVYLYKSKKYN